MAWIWWKLACKTKTIAGSCEEVQTMITNFVALYGPRPAAVDSCALLLISMVCHDSESIATRMKQDLWSFQTKRLQITLGVAIGWKTVCTNVWWPSSSRVHKIWWRNKRSMRKVFVLYSLLYICLNTDIHKFKWFSNRNC